jgi:hypothetical protein
MAYWTEDRKRVLTEQENGSVSASADVKSTVKK